MQGLVLFRRPSWNISIHASLDVCIEWRWFIPPIWRRFTGKALRLPPCRPYKSALTKYKFWVLLGSYAARLLQICYTTILLWMAMAAMLTIIPNTKFQIQAALGAKFESLLGKMLSSVHRQMTRVFLQSCQQHARWTCCCNDSQDSNQGFLPSGKMHSTDGAGKIAVFWGCVGCNSFSFRKVGALWRRPVWKRGVLNVLEREQSLVARQDYGHLRQEEQRRAAAYLSSELLSFILSFVLSFVFIRILKFALLAPHCRRAKTASAAPPSPPHRLCCLFIGSLRSQLRSSKLNCANRKIIHESSRNSTESAQLSSTDPSPRAPQSTATPKRARKDPRSNDSKTVSKTGPAASDRHEHAFIVTDS